MSSSSSGKARRSVMHENIQISQTRSPRISVNCGDAKTSTGRINAAVEEGNVVVVGGAVEARPC
jgi:hypothetical protein